VSEVQGKFSSEEDKESKAGLSGEFSGEGWD
jgi:hypothetical protein